MWLDNIHEYSASILTYSSDTIARVPLVSDTLSKVACGEIAQIVIYDLPGRDCAAKASNGELAVGEVARYKSEYIDRK
jgi:cellulose 1,4-beta-cellobiosidase